MPRPLNLLNAIVLSLTCLAAGAAADDAQFQRDLEALTAAPHRLAGTPEGRAAADYIAERLTDLGIEVFRMPLSVPQVKIDTCEIRIEGEAFSLLPIRPNVNVLPVTDEDGLTGPLIYAGRGEPTEYGKVDPAGAIVVLEYDCGQRWRDAFRLGAKAVIFLGREDEQASDAKKLAIPSDVVRLYASPEVQRRIDLRRNYDQVTVVSHLAWQIMEGQNIIGFIPGTDPVINPDRSRTPEALVLSAHYDSYGQAPHNSPGARAAANTAALLEAAAYLDRDRPRRHTILGFFDNFAVQRQGARAFYAATEATAEEIQTLVSDRRAEAEYVAGVLKVLQADDWTDQIVDRDLEELMSTLKDQADFMKADSTAQSLQIRLALRGTDPDESPELQDVIYHQLRIDNVRRSLAQTIDETPSNLAPQLNGFDKAIEQAETAGDKDLLGELTDEREILRELRERLIAIYTQRQVELTREMESNAAVVDLRDRLGEAKISLHLTYNLSDIGPQWGVVACDSTLRWLTNDAREADQPGHYGSVLRAFRRAADDAGQERFPRFEPETVRDPISGTRFVSGAYVTDGAIAGTHGIYNMAFMTGSDARPRDGHGSDTLANLRWPNLAAQAREATRLARLIGDSDGITASQKFQPVAKTSWMIWDQAKKTGKGHFAGIRVTGQLTEDRPARSATIAIWPNIGGRWAVFEEDLPFNFHPVVLTGANMLGYVSLESVPSPSRRSHFMLGALFNDFGRPIALTNDDKLEQQSSTRYRIDLIPGTGYTVFYPLLGKSNATTYPFRVLGAVTNVAFRQTERLLSESSMVGSVFIADRALRGGATGLKVFAERGPALLGMNVATASDEKLLEMIEAGMIPSAYLDFNEDGELADDALANLRQRARDQIGVGILPGELATPPAVDAPTARNMWQVNESRLRILRGGGIPNAAFERLHYTKAREDIERAETLDDTALKNTSFAMATARERRIYQPIRDSMNDLVRAVVLLLLLAMPFAFALERLLIGATTVYGRIGGFAGVFAVTFAALYMLHPGFNVATTPLIILLAFVIILLSAVVTYILMRKFNTELRELQGQSSKAHEAHMSRIGTVVAAANMGISTMRRRPLRTALTALTVILLTFTILCFASVGSQPGVRSVYLGSTGAAEDADLMIRNTDYAQLNHDVVDVLRGYQAGRGLVAEQWWLSREGQDPPINITRASDGRSQYVKAMMGVSAAELKRWPAMAEAMIRDGQPVDLDSIGPRDVFIPSVMRDQLDLDIGDPLLVEGRLVRFAGVLDTSALQLLKNIDNDPALPVDFQDQSVIETRQEQQDLTEEEAADMQRSYARLSPNEIAVAGPELIREMGGLLRIARVYLDPDQQAEATGRELAEVMPAPVWVRGAEGSERLIFAQLVEVQAGQELLVPLLLGGLIVFGTMLGSITDREKEIYTFSALGLAPAHVGLLFFAEAAVYAVVGGMGGQILAQVVAVSTAALGRAGWITPPELNFSSTNALFAIFIVMCTVMVSAILPAMRASKSANPGLARTWKLPAPDGDVLSLVFPFTVSAYDITGVVSFLAEHFRAHDDAGVGAFAAQSVHIDKDDDGHLTLHAEVALSPFDLGVTQEFMLTATPSEIPGVDEVAIQCHRLSGTRNDWQRTNKVFIRGLRKQFLLWRTLSDEAIESYRTQTLVELGEQPPAKPADDPSRATAEQSTGTEAAQ